MRVDCDFELLGGHVILRKLSRVNIVVDALNLISSSFIFSQARSIPPTSSLLHRGKLRFPWALTLTVLISSERLVGHHVQARCRAYVVSYHASHILSCLHTTTTGHWLTMFPSSYQLSPPLAVQGPYCSSHGQSPQDGWGYCDGSG